MNFTIDRLKIPGFFNDIDYHLADFLCEKAEKKSGLLYAVILLLSNRLSQGDVCLVPAYIAGRPLSDFLSGDKPDEYSGLLMPSECEIIRAVEESGIAGSEGDLLPLVIDGEGRIYFHKYYFYEKSLSESIKGLALQRSGLYDKEKLTEVFSRLFPVNGAETDWQAVSAWASLNSCFTVISGGPGTGKTFTVVKIIALLLEMMGPGVSVALAAPTGKAAARLSESVNDLLGALNVSDPVKERIPREASTIHRLLGSVAGSQEFRHNRDNPLRHDIVVVDECSMADLALMYRFFEAVKPGARVILLGDRDQLSSVEGGAVFGDICDRGVNHGYTDGFVSCGAELLGAAFASGCEAEKNSGLLNNSLTVLRKSYRFSGAGGIGKLAEMIRKGEPSGALEELKNGGNGDIILAGSCELSAIEDVFRKRAEEIFSGRDTPLHESVLGFITGFAILTATRKGPAGAEALNIMAERVLADMGIVIPQGVFYNGRPVMVTRNDYSLSLFNGDIGVTCMTGDGLKVMFMKPGGSAVYIHPSRVPEHDTAYAMTVHKSQGSEFDDVLVVLPSDGGAVMTRELLYTAVTRAKKRVVLAAEARTLETMICNPLKRMTGLRERLWPATSQA